MANPLLIDLVIERVFSSSKVQELKAFRLVCKSWSYIGRQILLQKCKEIALIGDSTRSTKINMKTLTKAIKSKTELPFTKFVIQVSVFSLQRSQVLEEFFSHSSWLMKSLSLTYQDHSHYLTCDQRNFFTFLDLPNLKHFRFEILPMDQPGFSPSTLNGAELFRLFFNAASNLVTLELIVSGELSSSRTLPFIQTIGSSSQRNHSRLRDLVLNAPLTDLEFNCLKHYDYQFKLIDIKFPGSIFVYSSPIELFEKHSSYLEHLKIDPWISFKSERKEKFPQFKSLQILEVLEWKPYTDSSPLPFSFTYYHNFPSLKKLSISSHHWQGCFINFFPKHEKVITVKELKLPKHIGVESSFLVNRISNTFPRLAKLELSVSDSSINCLCDIFNQLINLEDLSVSFFNWNGTKCIDYIFTGISETVCKQIYSLSDVSNVDFSNINFGPSILDLKGLKRLQLRNTSMFSVKGRPQYSDIFGYHLLKLAKLTTLSIWPSQISKDCLNELEKRFNLILHSF